MRKKINDRFKLPVMFVGFFVILFLWYGIYATGWVNKSIFPAPHSVLFSFKELHFEDFLVRNSFYSIYLNLMSYIVAVLLAVPIGFLIGLSSWVRGLFSTYVEATRYIPLTACIGIFVAWFGIADIMKVAFLATGIFVYLLPVVIQRIDEVPKVFEQTVYTLGATKWQTLRTVYFPNVFSRISDDIRVLTAISWTYLIFAEMVNASAGGLGAMSFRMMRQSRIDKVFAILIFIVILGMLQDRIFKLLDRILFPFKYTEKK